jgi:secreted PhoX family phosphatase
MQTAFDPQGKLVLGTLNNCANGVTPWGTYLTCEENINGYFVKTGTPTKEERRIGINANGFGYRWHEFDARFNADLHPNEANRFGWVVEIDPRNPDKAPVKRTALGRFKHEGGVYG